MPNTLPSESDLQTAMSKAVALLDEIRLFGDGNTNDWISRGNDVLDTLAPDLANDVPKAVAGLRSRLNSMLISDAAATLLRPYLQTYGRIIGVAVPTTSDDVLIDRIVDYFVANAKTVQRRLITFGSVSAGTNAGDGTVHRLTTDKDGFAIDSAWVEAKTAKCTADEHSGAREHEESFELRGAAAAQDAVEIVGSGALLTVSAMSARTSANYLDNPSFSSIGGGTDAVPTSISGWDVDTIANVEVGRNTGEFYRDYVGDADPAGLKLKGNVLVSQNLNTRRVTLDRRLPYYLQIAWNRYSSGDGTLKLRLGATEATVAVNTGTNGAWNILKIALGTGNWFDNFNEENLAVEIELASRTTGGVWVDDVVFGPFAQFDRTYVAIVGGDTPFLRDDSFSWTDTGGASGKIQRWMWRAFGRYLPHADGASTVTFDDPT